MKILIAMLIAISANAKWVYVQNANNMTILNDETGEIFEEYLGTMIRKKFTDDVKVVYDENNNPIKVVPSDDKRNTPKK